MLFAVTCDAKSDYLETTHVCESVQHEIKSEIQIFIQSLRRQVSRHWRFNLNNINVSNWIYTARKKTGL